MQNAKLIAARFPVLTTYVALLTPEQAAEHFGADAERLIADPNSVIGAAETAIDLVEDRVAVRTAAKAMVPSFTDITDALAQGWPAVTINTELLTGFLTDTMELPGDWQATADAVTELLETILLDDEALAESGILFAEEWGVLLSEQGSKKSVQFKLSREGHLPILTDAIHQDVLLGDTTETGVATAVDALVKVAELINQRAALALYADADVKGLENFTNPQVTEDAETADATA